MNLPISFGIVYTFSLFSLIKCIKLNIDTCILNTSRSFFVTINLKKTSIVREIFIFTSFRFLVLSAAVTVKSNNVRLSILWFVMIFDMNSVTFKITIIIVIVPVATALSATVKRSILYTVLAELYMPPAEALFNHLFKYLSRLNQQLGT